MPISNGTRSLLAAAILLALSNMAMAAPGEPGVSRALAIAREGTALGLACAVATGYVFCSHFCGAQSTALSVLLGSALLLVGPALAAIALPARRAALQYPAETLRRE